jgi:hypothetical protein
MAFTIPWDENEPDGSEQASTLDTELQNLKVSVRERLEDLIPDWANDAEDPKTLAQTAIAHSPRCVIERRADLTISDNSQTDVTWDTEAVDVGGMFDIGSPTQITIPASSGGFYLILVNVIFEPNATGRRYVGVVNGTTFLARYTDSAADANNWHGSVSWMGSLAAAAVLTVHVYQNSTGNLNLEGTAPFYNSISVIRLAATE